MVYTDWIQKWAIYSPKKIAVKEVESGRSYTYAEINVVAERLAHDLISSKGLVKGDRILVLAEHCVEYVILFSACQKSGLTMVPINYRLAPSEIEYLVQNCEPRLMIVEDQFLEKTGEIDISENTLRWTLNDFSDKCDVYLKQELAPNLDHINVTEDDPLFILYTSGTTGFPKGAIYTHKMLFWNSVNTTIGLNITSDDTTVLSMPPFHTGGWNVLLTPILHRGGTVILLKKFDAETILRSLEEEKASIFMAVPTMLKMMVESTEFINVTLESIRYFIVGGEALPLKLIKTWNDKGICLRQGYGLTEVGPNLTSLHHDDAIRKIGSIGKPNFYVESRVVDENDQEVSSNEIGEFCFKGDIVTPGYWNNEEGTRKSIKEGWFYTGDLVRKDEEGFIYVMDRKKNMFISGAENVYPAEVERIICQHPLVSEVAVIGVEDEKWGEVGKAFLVFKENTPIDDIKNYCIEHMAKFKVPKYYRIVEALPKTDSGKIDRKVITKMT
ncbi:MAG: long-chain fatty acid--CoA ligase [Bacteroidota bacterium]